MRNLVVAIGGKEIGQKLADRLNIKCYDSELLSIAAKNSGFCEEILQKNDEKPTNSFLYSLVMDTYSMSGYTSAPFVDMPLNHKVFLAQFEAIKKLASEESCVIVGRCADYALAGNPDCVSVFIHADMDFRLKRIKADTDKEFTILSTRQIKNVQIIIPTTPARNGAIHAVMISASTVPYLVLVKR